MDAMDKISEGAQWRPIASAPASEWLLCFWEGHGQGVAAKVLGKWMAPGARVLSEPSAWMRLPLAPVMNAPLKSAEVEKADA